jgi:hypothetical protein
MLILDDSSLYIYAMCNTDGFGFDHYASRDSSSYLLDCTHLTTSRPTGVPCAAGWCSTRLSHGPSTYDVDPLGCQLWTTQALHCSHSLPIPKLVWTALLDPHWRAAMEEEYSTLRSNGTWDLVPHPYCSNVVTSNWIFKQKFRTDGTLERYKVY